MGFGGVLGMIFARGSLLEIITCLISSAIVVFLTLPIHEYAHGYAAVKLGDPTPRYQGRLSFNPLVHLDYFGSLMIFLFGFGYAKPVQINARNFNNPKRDMAITAFAGPLSNLVIAFISIFLFSTIRFISFKVVMCEFFLTVLYILLRIFYYIAVINISLAVFNLIPIPPLDGSKLLAAFLPDRIYYRLMQYERYFTILIFALIFLGTRFSSILSIITGNIFIWFETLAWLPFKLFI